MGRPERLSLIRRLQLARNSKVLCYLTSDRTNAGAPIQKDAMGIFYEHLRKSFQNERIEVLIFSEGGDTLAAFGLCRLLREFTPWLGVLVPHKCHSAGTLLSLGANEIVMTRLATLSPIDPSLVRPLNPAIEIQPGQRQLVPVSVESVVGFKDLVTKVWGIAGEESLSAAFRILGERVHPLALGDVARVREQIERLARTLLGRHRTDSQHIDRIVSTLTKGLGSHDYLISRAEARELLGDQIAPDNTETEDLIWQLYQDFSGEMELGKDYDAGMELHAAKAPAQEELARLAAVAVQAAQAAQEATESAMRGVHAAQVAQSRAAQAAQSAQSNPSEEAALRAKEAQDEAAAMAHEASEAQNKANQVAQAAQNAQALQASHAAKVQAMTTRVVQRLALVESESGSHVCEKEIIISDQQIPMQIPGVGMIGTNKIVMQEVVRLGWRSYN